jgi:peptide/nickel transport system permease protein
LGSDLSDAHVKAEAALYTYLVRRLAAMLVTLLLVTIIVYTILNLTPGDPITFMLGPAASQQQVEEMRRILGLDQPVWKRYLSWLGSVAQGDLGVSLRSGASVDTMLIQRLPATAQLMLGSMFVAIVLGVPIGVLSAVKRNSLLDAASRVVALIGISMPSFWFALIAILVFAYFLRLLPPSGKGGISHLIMPSLTLGMTLAGIIMRITRSSMLEVLSQDYIRTARAKGLIESVVLYRPALRNALLPVITIIGLQIGALLGGTVVIETVFAWPGLGFFTYQAMLGRDYPVIMGSLVFYASAFLIINLLTDLAYGVIDPRIRYG